MVEFLMPGEYFFPGLDAVEEPHAIITLDDSSSSNNNKKRPRMACASSFCDTTEQNPRGFYVYQGRHYCSPCMRGNLLLALRFLCDTELKSELVSGHDFGWFLAWQDDNNQENYLVHIFTFQPYHEVKFFLVGGPEHDTVDVMRAWKGEEEEQSTTLASSSSRPLVRPGGLIDSDDDDDDDDLEIVPRNNPRPAARLFDEEDE